MLGNHYAQMILTSTLHQFAQVRTNGKDALRCPCLTLCDITIQCTPNILQLCISWNWIHRGGMLDPSHCFGPPISRNLQTCPQECVIFFAESWWRLGPHSWEAIFCKICSLWQRNQVEPTGQCGLEHMLCAGQPHKPEQVDTPIVLKIRVQLIQCRSTLQPQWNPSIKATQDGGLSKEVACHEG